MRSFGFDNPKTVSGYGFDNQIQRCVKEIKKGSTGFRVRIVIFAE
ncbi:hypothetical protein BN938_2991 [Mucinivorans hirudinis]|uniref:Uncharacterized protein n=1 Tax=Mucinivorans hirudinis TaxID=1433126 RepID=A0A060RBM7_9BACT|nr:hypothetical protein BN938_2991 [Mucinivorans hirudinis]